MLRETPTQLVEKCRNRLLGPYPKRVTRAAETGTRFLFFSVKACVWEHAPGKTEVKEQVCLFLSKRLFGPILQV